MLVDSRKLHTVTEAREGKAFTPSDYENQDDVFVFRIVWESEGEKDEDADVSTFRDALEFVANFPDEDQLDDDEIRAMLDRADVLRIGPDADRYAIKALAEPMKRGWSGGLVTLDEAKAEDEDFEPFDCRPGIDYPATLAR